MGTPARAAATNAAVPAAWRELWHVEHEATILPPLGRPELWHKALLPLRDNILRKRKADGDQGGLVVHERVPQRCEPPNPLAKEYKPTRIGLVHPFWAGLPGHSCAVELVQRPPLALRMGLRDERMVWGRPSRLPLVGPVSEWCKSPYIMRAGVPVTRVRPGSALRDRVLRDLAGFKLRAARVPPRLFAAGGAWPWPILPPEGDLPTVFRFPELVEIKGTPFVLSVEAVVRDRRGRTYPMFDLGRFAKALDPDDEDHDADEAAPDFSTVSGKDLDLWPALTGYGSCSLGLRGTYTNLTYRESRTDSKNRPELRGRWRVPDGERLDFLTVPRLGLDVVRTVLRSPAAYAVPAYFVFSDPLNVAGLGKRQARILGFVYDRDGCTRSEIAKGTSSPSGAVTRSLVTGERSLLALGLVRRDATDGKVTRKTRFYRPPGEDRWKQLHKALRRLDRSVSTTSKRTFRPMFTPT